MRVYVVVALAVVCIAISASNVSAVSVQKTHGDSSDEHGPPLRSCKWYQALCRFMNPCWYQRECHGYPDAVCVQDSCQCQAEFYVGEEKIDCREPSPEDTPTEEPSVIQGEGCEPVVCLLHCLDGFVKDANGCDTCRCVEHGDRPGICPAPRPDFGSICSIECSSDAGCDEGEKCCTNGCGRVCVPACSGNLCRINCTPFGGFALDVNGCEICRCLNQGLRQVCPVVSPDNVGICVTNCETDNECTNEGEKCCDNGCGQLCMRGCEPVPCRMSCEHGYDTDENNCEICKCKTPPGCNELVCRIGCKLGYERDENGCELCSCIEPQRPGGMVPFGRRDSGSDAGMCPSTEGAGGVCILACLTDEDCEAGRKCCSNGCGKICRRPCPGVSCRMACESYVKDDNGCDICRCKRPKIKFGKCPAIQAGICSNECETDDDCSGKRMKCCSNGCGRTCTRACSPVKCRMGCHWGYATNSDGCEICECLPSPAVKPGQCPATSPESVGGICTTECSIDSDCAGEFKCCSNNCGQVCVPACPSFSCRIKCPFGHLTDENGCQVCECRPPSVIPRSRICPVIEEGIGGICAEECDERDEQNPCASGQICCSNGCGHSCIEGCLPVTCRMRCPYGWARNAEGCEFCQCKETPTAVAVCPPISDEDVLGLCAEECEGDNDCQDGHKCCSNGCGHSCIQAVMQEPIVCMPLRCDLYCRYGYRVDDYSCALCECAEKREITNLCPVMEEGIGGGIGGICVEECGEQNPCASGQICCTNGCGHSCIEGCEPVMCRMRCHHGFARNEEGCEICQCKDAPSGGITNLCPVMEEVIGGGIGGICVEECGEQNPCASGQICCTNGCGHSCIEGCEPVMCRMRCPDGWARNEEGCEICQCKDAPSGGITNLCPVIEEVMEESIGGICVEECGEQNPCASGQICCSNGCGHSCIEGCEPVMCRMRCPDGWARNEEGCEICQCKDAPSDCRPLRCRLGCRNGYRTDENGCDICKCRHRTPIPYSIPHRFTPGPRRDPLAPVCPPDEQAVGEICSEECNEKNPCTNGQICCSNGCGSVCVEGCRPVLCRMYCPYGWDTLEETGCEICSCKRPTTELVCPDVSVGRAVGGICSEECGMDNPCTEEGYTCCSNGCGNTCVQGCLPAPCRRRCEHGFVMNEQGCEICSCAAPPIELTCPLVDRVGICSEDCSEESCELGQKCCSNGCGHACTQGCRPVLCYMYCRHGWARDELGCEMCHCVEVPQIACSVGRCDNDCPNGFVTDNSGCSTCDCLPGPMDLQCPEVPSDVLGICVESCGAECRGENEACCSNGCGHTCVEGCQPVMCKMKCPNGWARDKRGCEICQCRQSDEGVCTGGKVYQDCGSACPLNCERVRSGESVACTYQCVQGCGCPRYTALDSDNTCVEEHNCGCLYDSDADGEIEYYRLGDSFNMGNEQCQCHRNGEVRCQTVCPPTDCQLTGCRYGHSTDENGCETCNCNPGPEEPCELVKCRRLCRDGFKMENGCPVCKCNDPPKSLCKLERCRRYCSYGFATDENGCEICQCLPPPDVVCENGKIYQDCGSACPETCHTVRLDEPIPCIAMCVQGCFCPPNTAQDSDGMCVKQKQCGCLYDVDGNGDKEYFKLGESFHFGGRRRVRCQCHRNGEVICSRRE